MKCLGVKKGIRLCSSSAPYISTPRSMIPKKGLRGKI